MANNIMPILNAKKAFALLFIGVFLLNSLLRGLNTSSDVELCTYVLFLNLEQIATITSEWRILKKLSYYPFKIPNLYFY